MFEISGIGVLTAFIAGLISFLSPCVLPLVPGYISFIAEQSLEEMKQRGLSSRETLAVAGLSFCFVLGFSTVFIIFGASATALGALFRTYRFELNILGGAIVILFGLFMTGLFRFNWLQRDLRFHGAVFGGRPVASYLLGLAFAFGWTPCIGPILGSILTISATSGTVSDGAALLTIYSIGFGVPFVLAAIFTDRFLHHAKRLRRHSQRIQVVAGVLLIIMGVAMVTGYLSTLSIWLLQALPWLSGLGQF
jgi:cytochrome c-type biogenesis protein